MDEEIADKLCKELNQMQFFKEYQICLGDALFYTFLFYKKKTPLELLKLLLAPFLKYNYIMAKQGTCLLLFSSDYYKREDHKRKFYQVMKAVTEPCVVECVIRKKLDYSFLWKLWKLVPLFFRLADLNININLRLFICCNIVRITEEYSQLSKIGAMEFDQYKVLVTWCDYLTIDSLAVQIYNKNHVDTVTLQHGYYGIKTALERNAFLKSHSTYFLCVGNSTKKMAMSLGLPANKMIPVGLPELIGTKLPKNYRKRQTGIFGCVLSFSTEREENIALLTCSVALAKMIGVKCRVRMHPSIIVSDYEPYIQTEILEFAKEEKLEDYMRGIDFLILGNTAVFLTAISHLIVTFRYIGINNKFDTEEAFVFHSMGELLTTYKRYAKINSKEIEGELLALRKKFLTDGDVLHEYQLFFRKYV